MNKAVLMKKRMDGGKNAYETVLEELKVLKLMEHPNIIWLNEIIDDPKKDNLYIVTDWMSKGSLEELIESKNKGKSLRIGLSSNEVRNYFIDMVKALHYCHNVAGVIHRDIKPDNIMINHNNEAILIDFGVSALMVDDDVIHNNIGSLMFFAPEMFQRSQNVKVHGAKTDIWALGITFYYLMTGQYPYKANNYFDLKDEVLENEFDLHLIKKDN